MEAREARNPKTGEIIQVPSRDYLRFKAFDSGNERLN
jgi:nucleoid DNA-binding protein